VKEDGMRLWRISSTHWEKQHEATPWFSAKTSSIAIYHASPLAAVCAYLLRHCLPHPDLIPSHQALHSVGVSQNLIRRAQVSRHWHFNLKETRDLTLRWRLLADRPVLCVPALSGANQYLIDTRSPLFSLIHLYRQDAQALERSLEQMREHLQGATPWLVLR